MFVLGEECIKCVNICFFTSWCEFIMNMKPPIPLTFLAVTTVTTWHTLSAVETKCQPRQKASWSPTTTRRKR